MALRLLAFKQIHKILGMECLPSNNSNSNNLGQMRGARKRQYPSTGNDSQSKLKIFLIFLTYLLKLISIKVEEKKEKKDSDVSSADNNNNVEVKMESTNNI